MDLNSLPGIGSAGVLGAWAYNEIKNIKEDIDIIADQLGKIDPEVEKIERNRQSIDQVYDAVVKNQEINKMLFERLRDQQRVLVDFFYTLRNIQNTLLRDERKKTRPLGKETLDILFKGEKRDLKGTNNQNPSEDVVDELDDL